MGLLVVALSGFLPGCATTLTSASSPSPNGKASERSPNERVTGNGAPGEAAVADEVALPTRSEHSTGAFTLPELPAGLAQPPALTAELELPAGPDPSAPRQRRTVTRSAERVHVSLPARAIEWLFVRNSVDGRRVSASLIDHRMRTIVEYDESELRTARIASGWADVVSFGVPLRALQESSPTGRSRSFAGFEFIERRAREGGADTNEVWWSDEAAAPLRLSGAKDAPDLEMTSLRATIDPSLLVDPRRRFPGYAVMDIADFREAHHDHSSE